MSLTRKQRAELADYAAQLPGAEVHAAELELARIGATIVLNEPRAYIEPDEERGVTGGWRAGTCTARVYSTEGKSKLFTGVSPQHVLDQIRHFVAAQERLSPDSAARWELAPGPTAVPISQRHGSEHVSRANRKPAVRIELPV